MTVRFTVCTPARSPIAIDATLKSLASGICPQARTQGGEPFRRSAQMNLNQSLKPESNTRPGFAALFGFT